MLENRLQLAKQKKEEEQKNIIYVNIENIRPNPYQPRKQFNKLALEELCESVKQYGVIQPISVRKISANMYELVAGERRLRAAAMADLPLYPVLLLMWMITILRFWLFGRKTEFINVAGLKISPVEVETALNSHSDVIDSAVVGVTDEVYGEVVKAFVIKKQDSNLTERELIKYVSDKVANFKVPKYVVFVDEFPRNNVGKVDKKALKNM